MRDTNRSFCYIDKMTKRQKIGDSWKNQIPATYTWIKYYVYLNNSFDFGKSEGNIRIKKQKILNKYQKLEKIRNIPEKKNGYIIGSL